MDVTALVSAIEDGQPDLPEGVERGWSITAKGAADWASERIADAQAELADLAAREAEAMARIRARFAEMRRSHRRTVEFMTGALRTWAEAERPRLLKGNAKSYPLVAGRVGWRSKGGGLRVVDEAALNAWLAEQPVGSPLVRVKREPVMAAVKEQLEREGIIPPGMETVPEAEDFYVKADAPVTALTKGE